MILTDYRLPCQFTDAHDTVCMVHAILLYAIYHRVDMASATVKICRMDMYDQRCARQLLCVDSSRICQPVMRMNDVKLLLTCNDTCDDTVVIDFFIQIVRITPGELYATNIISVDITEIRIDVVTQRIVEFRENPSVCTFCNLLRIHIMPYHRHAVHRNDFQETLIFVAPWLRQAESDIHIWLHRQSLGQTKTGRTQSS